MHSSRMRTVRFSGRLSYHARPMPRIPPTVHTPPMRMPPAMHAPPFMLLPCMPLPTHAPCHACPSAPMPPATHPHLWTEILTHACENITFPQLLLRKVKIQLSPMYNRDVAGIFSIQLHCDVTGDWKHVWIG